MLSFCKTKRQREKWNFQPNLASSPPSSIALAGILLSIPVAIISIIAFLAAGLPLVKSFLIAWGLQLVVFCGVLVMGILRTQRLDQPQPNITGTREMLPENADIWRVYPGRSEVDNAFRIALIAPNAAQSRSIANDLAGLGYEVHHSTDSDAMFESVQTRQRGWDMVIFDMDLPPDLETGVDDLVSFRTVCPKVPVLLLSSSVLRDDFSDHRRLIGDATLRKPVFRKRLIEGIEATGTQDTLKDN